MRLTRIIPRQGSSEEIAKGLPYSKGHTKAELSLLNVEHGSGGPEQDAVMYAVWLKKITVCLRGCTDHTDEYIQADGEGDFATKFITKFGGYLKHIDNDIPDLVEYIYTLYPLESEDTVMSIYKVSTDTVIFIGTAEEALQQYDGNHEDFQIESIKSSRIGYKKKLIEYWKEKKKTQSTMMSSYYK